MNEFVYASWPAAPLFLSSYGRPTPLFIYFFFCIDSIGHSWGEIRPVRKGSVAIIFGTAIFSINWWIYLMIFLTPNSTKFNRHVLISYINSSSIFLTWFDEFVKIVKPQSDPKLTQIWKFRFLFFRVLGQLLCVIYQICPRRQNLVKCDNFSGHGMS